ncbi:MAG: D-alanine--D-alanine ligase [Clostridiaceae bacterium]|nr:D-alanine--D-alanine ligase [Clostridiaceae bacterium]
MKIAVVAGGLSPERDVSLSSGCLVANALRQAGHRVVLLDVYEGISPEEDLDNLFKDSSAKPYSYIVPDKAPDLKEIMRRNNNRKALIDPNVLKVCQAADVTFIALHGAMGENGQLQATFDVMGIKYTGTDYIGSLLAMDKDLTKKLLKQSGFPTADWVVFKEGMSLDSLAQEIGLPCVVKPCSAGSSIGVSIVYSKEELKNAIINAQEVDASVIVEKFISGREFSVGILDGAALPVIEIIPKQGFYDYKNKYQAGLTEEICPANLSEPDTKRVQELAVKVHRTLRLGSYSRVDFILGDDREFVCLEANTLPGMTPTSLLPQEALAAGISYVELCNKIIHMALK